MWQRALLEGKKSLPHQLLLGKWGSFSAHHLHTICTLSVHYLHTIWHDNTLLLKFCKKGKAGDVLFLSSQIHCNVYLSTLTAWIKLRKNWQIQSFFSSDKKVTEFDLHLMQRNLKKSKLESSWSKHEPVIQQLTSVAFFLSVIDGNKQPHTMLTRVWHSYGFWYE